MAKYSYSAPRHSHRTNSSVSYGEAQYVNRNLAAMSPNKAQERLKPTEAEPVMLQKRMAGCT